MEDETSAEDRAMKLQNEAKPKREAQASWTTQHNSSTVL